MKKLSRRDFMRRGCSGLAVLSVPFVFKANPLQAFGSAPEAALPLNDGYKMFGVDEALIRRIMGVALGKAGITATSISRTASSITSDWRQHRQPGLHGRGLRRRDPGAQGRPDRVFLHRGNHGQGHGTGGQTAASIADSGKTCPAGAQSSIRRRSIIPSEQPGEREARPKGRFSARHQPEGLFRGQTGDQVRNRPGWTKPATF